jgi:PIN domain nuclease of toxin-antitoxin system
LQDPANDLLLSAATVRELASKVGRKKLTLALPQREWVDRAVADLDLTILPVTVEHADRQASLPPRHKDPFDLLIAAQALVEAVDVMRSGAVFDAYGIPRVW